MTLQACDTFPSCLPSSSSPTFALMTFCSVLMSMLLSLLRGIDGPSNCQIKSEDFHLTGLRVPCAKWRRSVEAWLLGDHHHGAIAVRPVHALVPERDANGLCLA